MEFFAVFRNLDKFIYLFQNFSQNTSASPRNTSSTVLAGNILISTV